MTKYAATHRSSIVNPEEFWGQAAEGIDWEKRWDQVLEQSDGLTGRWFAGGRLNTCYNALDRHVERGRGEQAGRGDHAGQTHDPLSFSQRREDGPDATGPGLS